VRRTSAPARLVPGQIAADDPRLLADPFALWVGDAEVSPLTGPEISPIGRLAGGLLVYTVSILDAYRIARFRWARYQAERTTGS
jgi:hypothetical protein